MGDFDYLDVERYIIVKERSRLLQHVYLTMQSYLPLQYPTQFPQGEDGFHPRIPLNNIDKNINGRTTISIREWVTYRIHYRESKHPLLLLSRRLFHQFLVDDYSMVESSRLNLYKTHQKYVRAQMYKGRIDAILCGEINVANTGKRVVFPSSFTSGEHQLIQIIMMLYSNM